jgi:hypothetical protein
MGKQKTIIEMLEEKASVTSDTESDSTSDSASQPTTEKSIFRKGTDKTNDVIPQGKSGIEYLVDIINCLARYQPEKLFSALSHFLDDQEKAEDNSFQKLELTDFRIELIPLGSQYSEAVRLIDRIGMNNPDCKFFKDFIFKFASEDYLSMPKKGIIDEAAKYSLAIISELCKHNLISKKNLRLHPDLIKQASDLSNLELPEQESLVSHIPSGSTIEDEEGKILPTHTAQNTIEEGKEEEENINLDGFGFGDFGDIDLPNGISFMTNPSSFPAVPGQESVKPLVGNAKQK